ASNTGGPAAASAPISGARGEPTHAAGPQIPPKGGIAQFTAYSADDGPRSTVVVTGVIGDYGTAFRVVPNGGELAQEHHPVLSRGPLHHLRGAAVPSTSRPSE